MRVALLSTYDERGGAARAALRLHRALPATGVESRMIVQRRFGHAPDVEGPRGGLAGGLAGIAAEWRPRLESLPVRRYPRRGPELFSPAFLPNDVARRIARVAPDVLHLHWTGFGFVHPETLPRLGRPIVWTLHDSWPFTGGCHLPGTCDRYRGSCGACPALGSTDEHDLSRRLFERKRRAWQGLPLRIVAPSRWIADAARSSALFRDQTIDVIPNGIDLTRFHPSDRAAARARLGIDQDVRVILFSALEGVADRNKGFDLLWGALRSPAFQASKHPWLLWVVGTDQPPRGLHLEFSFRFAGRVDDEAAFAMHLAAADLVALPSRQENQPNLAVEAMACGRPVVAFHVAGIPDVVIHRETGYLARPGDPQDLAAGLLWVTGTEERTRALATHARARAERLYDLRVAASRHRDLYAELLDRANAPAGVTAGAMTGGAAPPS